MSVFVFAEACDALLRKSACEAVCQGRVVADSMGERLVVALIGGKVAGLVDEVTAYGADEIMIAEDDAVSFYCTESFTFLLEEMIRMVGSQWVLFAHTAMGKDLVPRLAERMGAGLASDCVAMDLEGQEIGLIRPLYAGKINVKLKIDTAVKLVTLRPNNFSIRTKSGEGQVRRLTVELPSPKVRMKGVELQKSVRPELTEAEIVVSGGRGLGKAEGFALIEQLADALEGAVGASRAAVDAGWRSQQHQVGQTGKVVTPNLYVACGISGAIQHIAGMGASKHIVAINKDREANMMKVADLAVEGDLYEILPELVQHLEKHSS